MKKKISSKNANLFFLFVSIIEYFSKPNIAKQRNGPNMINFEKEMRDGAFDQDTPPMQVII
jgi:hypothetical protein